MNIFKKIKGLAKKSDIEEVEEKIEESPIANQNLLKQGKNELEEKIAMIEELAKIENMEEEKIYEKFFELEEYQKIKQVSLIIENVEEAKNTNIAKSIAIKLMNEQEKKVVQIKNEEDDLVQQITRFVKILNKVKSQGKVMYKQEYGKLLEMHTDLTKKREEFLVKEKQINKEISAICEKVKEDISEFEDEIQNKLQEMIKKKELLDSKRI